MADNENTRAPAGGGEPTDNERMFRRALQWIVAIEDRFGLEKAREIARETLAASAPASAPLPLTDDRIVDCAVSAGLHDEMWFGQDTPKGYEDCMPKLRAFARLIARECLAAAPVADERAKLRMLTDDEIGDAYAVRWKDYAPYPKWMDRMHAVLHKFCEVNGLALSGGSPEPDGESQP